MKQLLIASLVFVSTTAFAQEAERQSEFFFQTPAGHQDVTPRLGYQMRTTQATADDEREKATGIAMTGVSYEYGINPMWAAELELAYTSLETDADPKTKESGLEDPRLNIKATAPMTWGRLRYGLNVGLGFEKRKVEANGDENTATGGYSLRPYVGADKDLAEGIVGGRLSYMYRADRTYTEDTGDIKLKGGSELGLSAFYEHFFADALLGGALNYRMVDAIKVKDSGVTALEDDKLLGVSVYSRVPVAMFELLPRLDYDFQSDMHKYDDLRLSVAGRFTF